MRNSFYAAMAMPAYLSGENEEYVSVLFPYPTSLMPKHTDQTSDPKKKGAKRHGEVFCSPRLRRLNLYQSGELPWLVSLERVLVDMLDYLKQRSSVKLPPSYHGSTGAHTEDAPPFLTLSTASRRFLASYMQGTFPLDSLSP